MHFEYEYDYDGAASTASGSLSHSNSDASSSKDDEDEGRLEDEYEERQTNLLMEYAQIFEFEDSVFRTRLPDDFVDSTAGEIDWSDVLNDAPIAAPVASTRIAEGSSDVCPKQSGPQPQGSAYIGTLQSNDGQLWRILESPATKRLKVAPCEGVIFTITPLDLNRKDLQAQLRDDPKLSPLLDAEDVYVGYNFRDPAGIALAVFDGAKALLRAERFIEALGNGRLIQKDLFDDIRCFCRIDRVKGSVVSTASNNTPTVTNTVNTTKEPTTLGRLVNSMRDATRLQLLINSAGGIRGCRFVTFDCEAAVVLPGAIPLPLEISFVDCSDCQDGAFHASFHSFIHPGWIASDADTQTAVKLSMCAVPGGHGIPFRRAAFLQRDYQHLAEVIDALGCSNRLDPTGRRIILINKGSIMDVQALRWIYAVAHAHAQDLENSAPLPIPGLLDIPMFDLSALEEALGVSSDAGAAFLAAKDTVGRCWYHGDMRDVFPSAHCAKHDARALSVVVRDWLSLSANA